MGKQILRAVLLVAGLLMFCSLSGFAGRPDLPGAFLKVEGIQVESYLIKVQYSDSEAGKNYEYQVNLEDGKIYIHPRPGGTKAIITVEPILQDFIARSPYSISNDELLNKWYNVGGKGYFDSHDFAIETKTGAPVESLADSPDLVQPKNEISHPSPDMVPDRFESDYPAIDATTIEDNTR